MGTRFGSLLDIRVKGETVGRDTSDKWRWTARSSAARFRWLGTQLLSSMPPRRLGWLGSDRRIMELVPHRTGAWTRSRTRTQRRGAVMRVVGWDGWRSSVVGRYSLPRCLSEELTRSIGCRSVYRSRRCRGVHRGCSSVHGSGIGLARGGRSVRTGDRANGPIHGVSNTIWTRCSWNRAVCRHLRHTRGRGRPVRPTCTADRGEWSGAWRAKRSGGRSSTKRGHALRCGSVYRRSSRAVGYG